MLAAREPDGAGQAAADWRMERPVVVHQTADVVCPPQIPHGGPPVAAARRLGMCRSPGMRTTSGSS